MRGGCRTSATASPPPRRSASRSGSCGRARPGGARTGWTSSWPRSPRRSDEGAPDWRALLAAAEHHVDLLGYSLLEIAEARQINKTLAAKAADGAKVRIALADAGSDAVAEADRVGRPPGRTSTRVREATERFSALAGVPGIELRTHSVAACHTLLRFDEHMLLTIHLYRTPGIQAPLLHLRRRRDYGLFDQLERHFEDVWQAAKPIPAPGAEAPPAKAARSPEDDFLERLDYVWRPER